MKNVFALARNRFQVWALSAILLLYFIPQVLLIAEPGMQEDEANFLVPSLELASGRPISFGYDMNLFGIDYPTMYGPYTGNSLTLPVALTVRIFGFDQSLIRLLWIIVGAGTILLTFLVCRELFNSWVGLSASLLLAVNPTFWMFTHVGAYTSASMTLDIMGSLFFFLYFYRTRRSIALFLAMFLTGHGLYTKLAFGYFLIAYLVSFAYLGVRRRLRKDILSVRNLLISAPAFLLGSWPLLCVTVTTGSTIAFLRTALIGAALSGQSNLSISENLIIRLEQTRSLLLEGRSPIDQLTAGLPVAYNAVMPYAFCGSLALLIFVLFWPGRLPLKREAIAFAVLVFVLYQFLIVFTPSTLNASVFVFIPPFIAMILALAFYLFHFLLRSKWNYLGWIALVGVVLLAFTESDTLLSQYETVRTTGGRGVWSSTIYQLTEYLLQYPDRSPVALDWGLDHPVYVLSDLRIKPSSSFMPFTTENGTLRLWQDSPPPAFDDLLENLIYQPQNIYLVRAERFAAFKSRLAFLERKVVASGAKLVKIHSIFEQDGQEFIKVYEVQWPSGRSPITSLDEIPLGDPSRESYPQITTLYPERSSVGLRPNQQPNGQGAIAVAGQGFDSSSVVLFNGEPLVTFYANEQLVTAFIPDKFLNSAGNINVSVINRERFMSNTLMFTVMPR